MMMLEEILNYIHNYFEKSVWRGNIVISSNSLSVDFLQEGQYFKIVGSVFNDGIHQYPCNDLHDEIFNGTIIAMAIPVELLNLAEEIDTWQNKYQEQLNSPYQSESFGGYSYTKRSGNTNTNESGVSWQTVFGKKLNHWRKIA